MSSGFQVVWNQGQLARLYRLGYFWSVMVVAEGDWTRGGCYWVLSSLILFRNFQIYIIYTSISNLTLQYIHHNNNSTSMTNSSSNKQTKLQPSISFKVTQLYSVSCGVIFLIIVIGSIVGPHGIITQIQQKFVSKNMKGNDNLTIRTEKGNIIQLPYLNSIVLTPKHVSQPRLTKINIQDVPALKQLMINKTKIQVAADLFENWNKNDPKLFQLEYYILNESYNLDRPVEQKRICIMSPFRNLLAYGVQNGSFILFLKSMNQQNYSNYHVYMIDDASTDKSTQTIMNMLHKYPRLNNRITIIKNRQKIGALGNRDSTTRNYCNPGDIVMDVDGDDNLIGKQVLNLFNRYYANDVNAWFVYNNYITIHGKDTGDGRDTVLDLKEVKPGVCRTIFPNVHEANTYRTNVDLWMTSETRTYLRDLYVKIPLEYVLERGTARYFTEASDRFTMYALAELAGPQHTFYFEQFNYFYYEPSYVAMKSFECSLPQRFFCQSQARILTPLLPLKLLTDKVERTPNYVIPSEIQDSYVQNYFEFEACQEKLRNISYIFANPEQL